MPDNTPLPIANGYYLSDSPIVSAQQCINLYPNLITSPALSQETLFPTAGLREVANTGIVNDLNRGSITVNGVVYFVNGNNLNRLNSDYSIDVIGAIAGSGYASMATNGDYLVVMVPGGLGSTYQVSTDTFTANIQAVDSDFNANGAPQYVVYIDGYFLFTTDEKKFIVSALNDPLSYNSLDFGSAEADPDDIVRPVVYFNQLLILGTKTIEGFENVGGAGFPFQRNGLIDDTGCLAPFSVIDGDDSFYFLGSGPNEGPSIYQFRGNRSAKISNTAIDSKLQDLTQDQLESVFAVHYGKNGQFFTAFSAVGINETFEFNAISSRWHQRRSFIAESLDSWRVASLVFAYGEIIVFDRLSGIVGIMDDDHYYEYGENIRRTVDTMPFAANANSFSVPSLELTMESGVGNADSPDPVIRMSRSIDGGNTFSDELSKPMGKVGEYHKRQIWRRQGRAGRFEMFRFECSEPVRCVMVKLQARFKGGRR